MVLTAYFAKTPGGRTWVIHHYGRLTHRPAGGGEAATAFRAGRRRPWAGRLGAAPAQGDALGYRDFGRPGATRVVDPCSPATVTRGAIEGQNAAPVHRTPPRGRDDRERPSLSGRDAWEFNPL